MKLVDIRKMTTEELAKSATELRMEIADLKKRLMTGEVQNVRILRAKRKDLARTLTVMSEQLAKESM